MLQSNLEMKMKISSVSVIILLHLRLQDIQAYNMYRGGRKINFEFVLQKLKKVDHLGAKI